MNPPRARTISRPLHRRYPLVERADGDAQFVDGRGDPPSPPGYGGTSRPDRLVARGDVDGRHPASSKATPGQDGSLGLTDTWYHYDHIGNVMNFSNSSGALVAGSIQHQDAWGNVLSSSTTGAWATMTDGRHLTTKEYDADAGMYYFWQRWYSSEPGRFAARAPFSGTVEHAYLYAEASPGERVDPRGEFGFDPSCKKCDRDRFPTTQECASKIGLILTDIKLQAKIENKMNDPTTTITCKQTGACNSPGTTAHAGAGKKEVNFCTTGGINKCSKTELCEILIHELAHKVGWAHNTGDPFMPGWNGSYTCHGKK